MRCYLPTNTVRDGDRIYVRCEGDSKRRRLIQKLQPVVGQWLSGPNVLQKSKLVHKRPSSSRCWAESSSGSEDSKTQVSADLAQDTEELRQRLSDGTQSVESSELDAPADSQDSSAAKSAGQLKSWQKGWILARKTARNVWPCAWQFLLLFSACDALNFLLVRICHRMTNEVALRFLLPPRLAHPSYIGTSLWYLTSNPEISNFRSGYLWISGLMLVLMLPLNVLLRTIAVSTAQLTASEQEVSKVHPGWRPPVRQLLRQLRGHIKTVFASLSRLWKIDILVAMQALPLQGLCLLVLPLPWSFPRLLNPLLANPLAVFEGKVGKDALRESQAKIGPLRKYMAYPFLGFLISARLIAMLGETFFVRILSPRIAREIPEIPLVVFLLVSTTTLALNRMSDLLPYTMYLQAKKTEEVQSDEAWAL